MENVIEMKGITKQFWHVLANNNVDFCIKKGEIVSLLGENGAGKTTLMKILYGMYSMDSGEIYVKGKKVDIKSPKDAISLGIGMVHQHFTLVKSFTVTENVILGLPPSKGIEIDLEAAKKDLISLSKKYELEVNPDEKIWQLSVGEKQRVEIIKALYRNIDVLILDEPTAVLTPQEAESLFDTLRLLTKEGKSIVFISHKLGEVMEISDRIVILRNGALTGEKNKKDTTKKELARLMVGREVIGVVNKYEISLTGKPILKVVNVSALNDKGLVSLKKISFEIFPKEILGIAGVSGNGQRELAEILSGTRKPISGNVYFKGKDITNNNPEEMVKLGIGRVPEDRMEDGLILDLPVFTNLAIESYKDPQFSKGIFLNYKEILNFSKKLVKEYDIKASSVSVVAKTLSGGNLQKLILARVLSQNPNFLIASQPTRGLDIGAMEYVHKKLIETTLKGSSVLLISEDLDEILNLSDRIIVLYEGEIMGAFKRKKFNMEMIGLMMTGLKTEEAINEISKS